MNENSMFQDFAKAQTGFSAAKKTSKNPQFNSRYSDINSCLEAVLPSLHANNFALRHKICTTHEVLSVECVLVHSSGGEISSGTIGFDIMPAGGEVENGKDGKPRKVNIIQKLGSIITYLRRYTLVSVCGLEQEDDDSNSIEQHAGQYQRQPPQKVAPPAPNVETKATQEQINELKNLMHEREYDKVKLWKHLGTEHVAEAEVSKVLSAINSLKNKPIKSTTNEENENE